MKAKAKPKTSGTGNQLIKDLPSCAVNYSKLFVPVNLKTETSIFWLAITDPSKHVAVKQMTDRLHILYFCTVEKKTTKI